MLREKHHRRRPPALLLITAGLSVGTIGGASSLLYLLMGDWMRGLSGWTVPNLMAAVFDPAVSRGELSWNTAAGAALYLATCGISGALAAAPLGRVLHRPRALYLLGVTLGLAWYYLTFRYVWTSWNPRLVVQQPFPDVVLAHVVLGFCLGLLPYALDELRILSALGSGDLRPALEPASGQTPD